VFGAAGAAGLFLAVALGAFAAHSLRDHLSAAMIGVFDTGVRYQFYHSLSLVAILADGKTFFRMAGIFYVAGILLFSSSLYLLACTGIGWIGFVTPFGGLSFLLGHLCLLIGFIKR